MKSLSAMMVPSAAAWIEYPGCPGFEVQLAHLTKDELMKIRDKSTTPKMNRKTRQMEDEVDSDLFQSLYIEAVIKNWRGLKLKYLNKFVVTNIGDDDPEEELEFSIENAETFMKNAVSFDSWVSDAIEDLENFTTSSSG